MYTGLVHLKQKIAIRSRVKGGYLFARILTLSAVIRILLYFISPTRIVKWLDGGSFPIKKIQLNKVVKYADIVTRFKIKEGRCLLRSLILFRLFKKAGLTVSINFGVKRDIKSNGELAGHSWVCINGYPVSEVSNPEQTYELIHSHNAICSNVVASDRGERGNPMTR